MGGYLAEVGPIKTIMVVDDEPALLTQIQASLQADEVEVITAVNSRQALELLENTEEDTVDLILIDTPMPGSDKTALFSMKPNASMETTVGVENFLEKPFTPERLRDFVHRRMSTD
jgi:DNA-binding NtrC family response regulator